MTQQHTAEELAQILDAMERKLEREERIRAQAPAMLDALRNMIERLVQVHQDEMQCQNWQHCEVLAQIKDARAIIAAIEEEG